MPGLVGNVEQVVTHIKGLKDGLKDWDADHLVRSAQIVARTLQGGGDPLDTQIYKVLGHIRRLEQDFQRSGFDSRQVRLLEPRLEWAVARQERLKDLYRVLVEAIQKTKTDEDFQQFVEFVQAVVAHHKYLGRVPPQRGPAQAGGPAGAGERKGREGRR